MTKLLFTLLALSVLGPVAGCSGGDSGGSGGAGPSSADVGPATGSGGGATTSVATTASSTSTTTTTTTTTGTGGGSSGAPTVTMTVDPPAASGGATVTATVAVTNFALVAPVGQPDAAGEGHYHIYLDDDSGGDYLVADEATTVDFMIPVAAAVGPHTLRISLGGNDHAPLFPAVEDVLDFDVQ